MCHISRQCQLIVKGNVAFAKADESLLSKCMNYDYIYYKVTYLGSPPQFIALLTNK